MFTDRPEMITRSARLPRIFFTLSLLIVCSLTTNGFAENKTKTKALPASSKVVEPETKNSESSKGEKAEEKSQVLEAPEEQAVMAENYTQPLGDSMVAAPAFDN